MPHASETAAREVPGTRKVEDKLSGIGGDGKFWNASSWVWAPFEMMKNSAQFANGAIQILKVILIPEIK